MERRDADGQTGASVLGPGMDKHVCRSAGASPDGTAALTMHVFTERCRVSNQHDRNMCVCVCVCGNVLMFGCGNRSNATCNSVVMETSRIERTPRKLRVFIKGSPVFSG